MSKIEIGKIINIHGLRGTLKVQPWTDYPEKFEEIKNIYINDQNYVIENVAYHKQSVLLNVSGINSVELAEKMRNCVIMADRSELGELPEGVYYIVDLIGCEIYENDTLIGVVKDVLNTGGVDIYEIKRPDQKPLYFPAARENVVYVDIEKKIISVNIPNGLLDL